MKLALLSSLGLFALVHLAPANVGWTEAQMRAAFGKGTESDSQIGLARTKLGLREISYRLPKAQFAELHQLGITEVSVELLDGKVVTVRLQTSSTWEKKAFIPYEKGKRAALRFLGEKPEAASITAEQLPADPKNGRGEFRYGGWRVTWEPQEVAILPLPESPEAKRLAEIVRQTAG
ncbi:MAG: hypothetical protein JSR82_01145 [Verrucomicrobia bacterium]|nr:hypothetical protein [Verrucomicrobiota bacterium]